MRIAICDDDERDLAHLLEMIAEYQSSRGVNMDCRSFHNGTEFLCDMKGGTYDLVFLDIFMQGVSGLQIAQELRAMDANAKFVFVSASSEFAVESYRMGAYYYLLKPVDASSLFMLLDKALRELSIQKERGFILKNKEGVVRIAYTELEYVEVLNKTVFFHLSDGVIYEKTAALGEFEEELLGRPEFVKTHRSYLVNLSCVQAVGVHYVVTENGHNVPISRQRRSQVQDAYMQFLHQAEMKDRSSNHAIAAEKPKRPDGPWQILLVDDAPDDLDLWAKVLQSYGCIVHLAKNGEDALKLAEEKHCDCVLLDVMIPGEDGFSICRKLRRLTQAPIIFLSCLTDTDKQLEGFAAGGIDYITKDTPAELFWAKVKTRIKLASSDCVQMRFGPLLLNLTERKAQMNGKELLLTPIEFDILWQLSEHVGRIFTPEEVFNMVRGDQPCEGEHMVQMHMSRLRRKLDTSWKEHCFIETVWGQGYRFVSPGD